MWRANRKSKDVYVQNGICTRVPAEVRLWRGMTVLKHDEPHAEIISHAEMCLLCVYDWLARRRSRKPAAQIQKNDALKEDAVTCAASSTKDKPQRGRQKASPRAAAGEKTPRHRTQWVGGDKRATSSRRSRINGAASETKKKKKRIRVDVIEPKRSNCVMKINLRVKQERRVPGGLRARRCQVKALHRRSCTGTGAVSLKA